MKTKFTLPFALSILIMFLSLNLKAAYIPVNVNDSLALVDLYNSTNGANWKTKTNWLTKKVNTPWYGVTVNSSGRVTKIVLNGNNLEGTIPASIGNLTYLSRLDLSGNLLSGNFPSSVGNLTSLFYLYLQNNTLSGSFTPNIQNCSYLIEFNISSNQFTGNVLDYIKNLTYLTKINISQNLFSGQIPVELDNLSTLDELNISENKYIFKYILPVFEWSRYGLFTFNYSNQLKVGTERTISKYRNENVSISIDGYEPSPDDKFQWYFKNTPISGKTDSVLVIPSTSRNDAGDYHCDITNPGILSLTLSTNIVNIDILNHIPVSIAGTDQTVNELSTVNLNGSSSYDLDNDTIHYSWVAPIGVFLSDPNSKNPSFSAPEVQFDSTFIFILTVYDGINYSIPDTVNIRVRQVNKKPVAFAGDDIYIIENSVVSLDGSHSWDADFDSLTYLWTPLNNVVLSSDTASKPTFTAPEIWRDTTFYFSLVVNDGIESSLPDTVAVTILQVNKEPVAVAGVNQIVKEDSLVYLDGSGSWDFDHDSIYFKWTPPANITLNGDTLIKPSFIAPEVTKDSTIKFYLVVNDGALDSKIDSVTITVLQVNKPPVANAGPDQTVNENSLVTLDGSRSSDFDHDTITYLWVPPTGITLDTLVKIKPVFTAPEVKKDTTYQFILSVFDGELSSLKDTVAITVKQVNKIPVANAGIDQTVREKALVTLNGAASSDGDDDKLSFKWTAPASIKLSASNIANPTFTAPIVSKDTTYKFLLIVNDGITDSPADTVAINILNNNPPVANAGANQSVDEKTVVTLQGSFTDAESDPVTYIWTAPAGITLSSNSAVQPTFTAPDVTTDTTYTFTLVVNDGYDNSKPDTVLISVKNLASSVPQTLAMSGINLTSGQKCYNALQTITVAGGGTTVYFQSGSSANLIAGVKILLEPGFHAYSGSFVHAYITKTNDFCTGSGSVVENTIIAEKSGSISELSPEKPADNTLQGIKVYPNPSTGKFTVELINFDKPALINVYNSLGIKVNSVNGLNSANLNLSNQQKGFYIIQVTEGNTVRNAKILIR